MKEIVTKEPFFCRDCKHWLSGTECKAFDLIPLEVYANPENAHAHKLDGQKGDYTFEANREPDQRRDYTF